MVQEVGEKWRDACDRDHAELDGGGFLERGRGGGLCWSRVTSGKEGR